MNHVTGLTVRVCALLLTTALFASPAWGQAWQTNFQTTLVSPKFVALGNYGTQVLAGESGRVKLFSSFGTAQTPIWSFTVPYFAPYYRVAASRNAGSYAYLAVNSSLAQPTITLYKFSNSGTPDWSKTLPVISDSMVEHFHVAVSNAGDRIVTAVFNQQTGKIDVSVFSSTSPTPTATAAITLSAASSLKSVELSANGQKLAFNTGMRIAVLNLATMTMQTAIVTFMDTGADVALSGDGSLLAYSGTVSGAATMLRLYQFNAATSQYDLRFDQYIPGYASCDLVDLSENGLTLAAACADPGFLRADIKAYDVPQSLAWGQLVSVLDASILSTGGANANLQNYPKKLRISADGKTIAVAVTGDVLDATPEVAVFRVGQNQPIASFNAGYSPTDLDISANGRFITTSGTGPHLYYPGAVTQTHPLSVFSDVSNLSVSGLPRAGQTITVTVTGALGASATLLSAPTLATSPTNFAYGTLYLQRSTLTPTQLGLIQAGGSVSYALTLPSTPGQTIYLQGFHTNPRRFTPNWIPVTVVP